MTNTMTLADLAACRSSKVGSRQLLASPGLPTDPRPHAKWATALVPYTVRRIESRTPTQPALAATSAAHSRRPSIASGGFSLFSTLSSDRLSEPPALRRGVMIFQPVFDLVPFRSGNDAPPFHRTRSLAVFSHDVRILVEHFDHAGTLGALKAVPVGCRFEFLDGSRVFGNLPPRGACVCYTGQTARRFLGLGRHVVGPLLYSRNPLQILTISGSPLAVLKGSEGGSAWRFRSSFFAIFSCCLSLRCCSFSRF